AWYAQVMSSKQTTVVCRDFASTARTSLNSLARMVRKGSPVRVRQRAPRKDPANAGSSCFCGQPPTPYRGGYRGSYRGSSSPLEAALVPREVALAGLRETHDLRTGLSLSRALVRMDQLQLSLPAPETGELLTIAEAAERV